MLQRQDDIKEDLAIDLKNVAKCGFNNLVKYFLYLGLKESSAKKRELDRYQSQIEDLQRERLYPSINNNGGKVIPQSSDAGSPAEGSSTTESTGQGKATGSPITQQPEKAKAGPLEKDLVEKREGILNKLLTTAIKEVVPIANSRNIKKLLIEFHNLLRKDLEKQRYGPYVKLCNAALDKLKNVDGGANLPLRPDMLDIRFQVNDPNQISSRFEGGVVDLGRSPDVLASTRAALSKIHQCTDANLEDRLPSGLQWDIPLTCHEFKVHNKGNPAGWMPELKAGYTYTDNPNPTESLLPVETMDVVTQEERERSAAGADSQIRGGSKRSNEVANIGSVQQQPPAKRVKGSKTQKSDPKSKGRTPGNTPAGSASHPVPVESQSKKAVEGRVQCASYALEMMSYSAGVHHVINVLFTDGVLWVWYYDRQGIVQAAGINICHNFPHFLVLLLAFQRFSIRDWGIIPELNPEAERQHSAAPEEGRKNKKSGKGKEKAAEGNKEHTAPRFKLDLGEVLDTSKETKTPANLDIDGAGRISSVELNMSEFLSYQPHCLSGRATAVVSATGYRKRGPDIQMVCKMYHPEVQRRHEGLTMEVIYDIAKEDQARANHDQKRSELGLPSMLKHLPSFYFYCDVKGTTTHRIRSMVGHDWDGHRTMRIIGMKQLKKITTIKGWEFVKAWLEGVVCHSFLWQNFVEHGDPSLSNLMYDPVEKCGVLTDFDLSLLQWEPRVFGTDRTGTIPFMALDLLTSQYWTGYRARYYHHELESFLWILPYVFLLYQDGKRKGTAIEDWITSSYDSCFAAKLTFLSKINDAKSKVQSDFENCWVLASALCRTLRHGYGVILDTRDDFNARNLDLDNFEQENLNISSTLRESFYKQLEKSLSEDVNAADCTLLLDRIEYFKPTFDLSIDKRRTIYDELYIKYSKILHPTQDP